MGISGLLPALKSIQTTRHLKEFGGKTVAVDAYVWLHKGIYACATDLATGKSTTKYVDYAMHRVRMLRHYKIEPYVVFDGGPLPAKQGTESERRKRREENSARGKVLSAQGKHSQARDCYLKCVDVTPQMAFQFIKALRAESVAYVVAPYEADAQLAYLERVGLVDAIITEDSDLLVFGCQNVLFKLDTTAATVVEISRKDFGTVSSSALDISLVGWTDLQFRTMAILSGCDYLPSIPGIGLKRACGLVRKWKTADQVIKAIMLEGKKAVPVDYAKKFKLAEMCFLHQRVYCPLGEKLVHMTPVDLEWTKEFDDYCGGDLEPGLAKRLAMGDVDPVELIPIIDINVGFNPRPLNKIPMITTNIGKKGKSKEADILGKPKATGGIFNFFGPNPVIPPRGKTALLATKQQVQGMAGKASGKRTLVEIAEHDHASRKKHKPRQSTPAMVSQSKFFVGGASPERPMSAPGPRRHSIESFSEPSRLYQDDKENILPEDWKQVEDEELDRSDLSVEKEVDSDADSDLEILPGVEQEAGYISPMGPSSPGNYGENLSSPPHRSQQTNPDDDLGEPVSSPASASKCWRTHRPSCSLRAETTPHSDDECFPTPMTVKRDVRRSLSLGAGKILADNTPTPISRSYVFNTVKSAALPIETGPDLRDPFGGPDFSEIGALSGAKENAIASGSATPPSPSPMTPASVEETEVAAVVIDVDEFDLYDEEEMAARAALERTRVVAEGWKNKWAMGSSQGQKMVYSNGSIKGKGKEVAKGKKNKVVLPPVQLKRSNTNVTPAGRHSLGKQQRLVFQYAEPVKTPVMTFFQPRKMAKPRSPIVIDDLSDEEDEIMTLSSPAATVTAKRGSLERYKFAS